MDRWDHRFQRWQTSSHKMDPMLRDGKTCQGNNNLNSTIMLPPPLLTPVPISMPRLNRKAHPIIKVPNITREINSNKEPMTTNQAPQEVLPMKRARTTMQQMMTTTQSTQTILGSLDQRKVSNKPSQPNNIAHNRPNPPNNNQPTLHATLLCDLHLDDNNS